MKKYDVICPHCCGTFHETTINYRPGVPVKGHMLTSKQHVKDAGWSTFPEYDSTEYADICCPSCNQQYLDALGLIVRMVESGEIEEPEAPFGDAVIFGSGYFSVSEKGVEGIDLKDVVVEALTDGVVEAHPAPELKVEKVETPKKKPGRPKK